jgi:hypothetical protein
MGQMGQFIFGSFNNLSEVLGLFQRSWFSVGGWAAYQGLQAHSTDTMP